MSAVLSRLVARAKGTLTPRLTPRVPGRFEGDSVAGDFMIEAATTPAGTDPQQPGSAPALPPVDAAAPARLASQPADAQKPKSKQSRRQEIPRTSMPAERSNQVDAPRPTGPLPLLERSDTSEPLAPVIQSDTVSPQTAARPAPPAGQIVAPNASARHSAEAPAPLIAPVSGTVPDLAALVAFLDGGASAERTPAQAPAPAAAPVSPPEITVHIGQIDIRTDQGPKQRAQPAKRAKPQMTDLSEYLRAGRSGR